MVHLTKDTSKSGPLTKELMQCQSCFKSRVSGGVTLSRCAGCRIAWYCSRECQAEHWPRHKALCKASQTMFLRPPEHAERMKLLRAFTAKHRPTLIQLGRLALDLYDHPENWLKYVLLILVVPRRDSKKAETAFEVIDIKVETPDLWHEQDRQSILVQFDYMRDHHKRTSQPGDPEGGYYTTVFRDVDLRLHNIVGVGLSRDLSDEGFDEDNWKDVMKDRMNRGIVLDFGDV